VVFQPVGHIVADMISLLAARRVRWLLPIAVGAAIAATSLTANVAANASEQPKLAARTAAQLLAAVEQASPAAMSGTIVETVKLGLPQLPNVGGSGGDSALSLQNLATGSHTVRVWYAGSDRQRIALLGQLSESDIVHNGTDLWTYSSSTRAVTHSVLAKSADAGAAERSSPVLTPQAAAQQALAAIDPTTTVQVDRTARVARQAAYQLMLQPKDTRSLIGSVRIAIDAATSVPLRVQVYAKGATSPAIQVGFTDLSYATPPLSVFHFVPPAGATVTQQKLPFSGTARSETAPAGADTKTTADASPGGKDSTGSTADAHGATVLGSGWTAVVQTTMNTTRSPSGSDRGAAAGIDTNQLLDKLATPVAGGRLITSALLSVFITDDGRVLAGPVSGADLQRVAASGHGL
jgi:outer membrane lipoprotein-sorting protein